MKESGDDGLFELELYFQHPGQSGHDQSRSIGHVSEREATRSNVERDLVPVVRREEGVGDHKRLRAERDS